MQEVTHGGCTSVRSQEPELLWGIIVSMWVGNLLPVILNLPLIEDAVFRPVPRDPRLQRHRHLQHQQQRLRPLRGRGVRPPAYMLVKCECEPAPPLLGFVLGPMPEGYLRRAMIISRGDPTVFVTRPVSQPLIVIAVGVLVVVLLPNVARKRDQVFVEKD